MRHLKVGVFLVSAILAGAAVPAGAVPVTGTVTGILTGTDTYGYFGGGSLTGQSISITYSFDTDLMSDGSFAGYNVFGVNGTNPNAVTLSATIGATTVSAGAGGNGALVQWAADPTHVNDNLRAEPGTVDLQVYFQALGAFVQGQPIDSPFPVDSNPPYIGSIYIAPVGGGGADDFFTFSQIADDESSDVPEPASLALLGAGLGGLGFLRRKRR